MIFHKPKVLLRLNTLERPSPTRQSADSAEAASAAKAGRYGDGARDKTPMGLCRNRNLAVPKITGLTQRRKGAKQRRDRWDGNNASMT